MNVLIDTNVILDDILNRFPNKQAARKISELVMTGVINGCLTANCLTDIFYIVSKKCDNITAGKVVKNLLLCFSVVSVSGEDCWRAINLPMPDFEDALVAVCAEKASMDYIITNDKGFLKGVHLNISVISPADFLLMFES